MALLAQTVCGLTCCDTASMTAHPHLRRRKALSVSECFILFLINARFGSLTLRGFGWLLFFSVLLKMNKIRKQQRKRSRQTHTEPPPVEKVTLSCVTAAAVRGSGSRGRPNQTSPDVDLLLLFYWQFGRHSQGNRIKDGDKPQTGK